MGLGIEPHGALYSVGSLLEGFCPSAPPSTGMCSKINNKSLKQAEKPVIFFLKYIYAMCVC